MREGHIRRVGRKRPGALPSSSVRRPTLPKMRPTGDGAGEGGWPWPAGDGAEDEAHRPSFGGSLQRPASSVHINVPASSSSPGDCPAAPLNFDGSVARGTWEQNRVESCFKMSGAAASLGSAVGHPVEAAERSRRAYDAHVRGTRRSASVPARPAEDAPNPVCGIPPPKLTPAACLALVTNAEVRVADGTDHMVLTVPRDLLDKNLRVGITVTYPKGIFRSGLAKLSSSTAGVGADHGRISFEGDSQAYAKGVRGTLPHQQPGRISFEDDSQAYAKGVRGTLPHQQPTAAHQPPEDGGAAAAEPAHEPSRRARRRANRASRAAIEMAAPPLQQTRGPPAADLATCSPKRASSTGMARSPAPMSSCAMPMSMTVSTVIARRSQEDGANSPQGGPLETCGRGQRPASSAEAWPGRDHHEGRRETTCLGDPEAMLADHTQMMSWLEHRDDFDIAGSSERIG